MAEKIEDIEAESIIDTVDSDDSSRIVLEGRIHHNSPVTESKKKGKVQLEFQLSSTSFTEESFEMYLQQFFTLDISPEDLVEVIHDDISGIIDSNSPSTDLYVQISYKNPHSSKTVTKGQLA